MEMNLSDDFIRVLSEKFKKILKKYKRWIYDQNYYKKNKSKINDKNKKWGRNNIDKIKISNEKYRQSENAKKNDKISKWKLRGVICDDYDALYEKVINTTNCEECNVLLTEDSKKTKTTRCMDHDHTTGLFRNVLCLSCNFKRK
jgi:hypothetical protein